MQITDNYLGDNLRKIRKLYERKQTDIASCIGISVRQYRKMENDEIPVQDKYLLKLADCYSIAIQTLREFNATHVLGLSENADNQVSTPPHQGSKETKLPTYTEQRTATHYEELLAAKEITIKSQREFIAFLSQKRNEQS
jgi:transcriptional regulator with XRE-family HTH domain